MSANEQLNVFLKPKSVVVIGATEWPGSWGVSLTDALGAEGLRVPELNAGVHLRCGNRECPSGHP